MRVCRSCSNYKEEETADFNKQSTTRMSTNDNQDKIGRENQRLKKTKNIGRGDFTTYSHTGKVLTLFGTRLFKIYCPMGNSLNLTKESEKDRNRERDILPNNGRLF